MAAQKGSAMLMKAGNAGSPETFTTIGGLRSTSISVNNESVDVKKLIIESVKCVEKSDIINSIKFSLRLINK